MNTYERNPSYKKPVLSNPTSLFHLLFSIRLRFKAPSLSQICYFPRMWFSGELERARLSVSGMLSLVGTWKTGLLLIVCQPTCMNPIKGTITIRTLYSLQNF